MKAKKVIYCVLVSAFILGLLSSCAMDKRCPAYSKSDVKTTAQTA